MSVAARTPVPPRSRGLRAAATTGLGAAYVVLVVAAIVPAPAVFAVFTAVVVFTELWLSRQAPALLPELLRSQLGARFRLLSADVLTAVLAARTFHEPGLTAVAIVVLALLHGARDAAGIFARRIAWRRNGGPLSWRNLEVPGLPKPVASPPVQPLSVPLSVLSLVMPVGFAVTAASGLDALEATGVEAVALVVVLFLAVRGTQYVLAERRSRSAVRAAVRQAVAALRPQVVLHFSGRRGTTDQVLGWIPTLRALHQRCVVLVREPSHLDALDGCGLPVVFAPLSTDVELLAVDSIEVALYPTDATNINNHLLRVPRIYDVLVGHGDSDEPENRSPIARMYDEIWVAGPAGRLRYAYPESGVPQTRIRELGPRPIAPRGAPAVPAAQGRATVLWAPAWESPSETTNLSSLVERGDAVLDALLDRRDVCLLFAPAAATGSRLPQFATALAGLVRRVEEAGAPHAVLDPEQVPAAMERASLVLTDVSPVVSDAIAFDTPFAVPTLGGRSPEVMQQAFPTVRAGAVVDELPGDLIAAIEQVRGGDPLADMRWAQAARLFGTRPGGFQQHFQTAVDEAVAAQRRRSAFARS